MAITRPLDLKSKNKTTLFPPTFKVEGNKVDLFFDLELGAEKRPFFRFLGFVSTSVSCPSQEEIGLNTASWLGQH